MKLFLISRTDNTYYDEYDSVVVASETAESAIKIDPSRYKLQDGTSITPPGQWASPEFLDVKYIGEAAPGINEGVILESYNGG